MALSRWDVAHTSTRPTEALGCALEHRKQALDFRAKPVELVEVRVVVPVVELDQLHERFCIELLLVVSLLMVLHDSALDPRSHRSLR